jgi:hypothetical protein
MQIRKDFDMDPFHWQNSLPYAAQYVNDRVKTEKFHGPGIEKLFSVSRFRL